MSEERAQFNLMEKEKLEDKLLRMEERTMRNVLIPNITKLILPNLEKAPPPPPS